MAVAAAAVPASGLDDANGLLRCCCCLGRGCRRSRATAVPRVSTLQWVSRRRGPSGIAAGSSVGGAGGIAAGRTPRGNEKGVSRERGVPNHPHLMSVGLR